MTFFPCFLSVVVVFRNQEGSLQDFLIQTTNMIDDIVEDYEIVIVDNASTDQSIAVLQELTGELGLANLQVYALTKEVDTDTACWVGIERSLGDFVVVLDPSTEDINFVPSMLSKATEGADVVFAHNNERTVQTLPYRAAYSIMHNLYGAFNGVNLLKDAPHFRLLSKKVINFILQHPRPSLTYRHLPATAGFSRAMLRYSFTPRHPQKKRLRDSIDRGIGLLVSTTRAPMRLVTWLSVFGASANFAYSFYVIAVGIFQPHVAPGWVSLSLQQSGMFFLISMVLLVLGEYILQMATLTNEGPKFHVAQEFTSAKLTRKTKLNIEMNNLAARKNE